MEAMVFEVCRKVLQLIQREREKKENNKVAKAEAEIIEVNVV